MARLRVELVDVAVDDERLEQAALRLRDELRALPDVSVDRVAGGEAPAGTRGGLVTELSTLLVTIAPTVPALWQIVQVASGCLTGGGQGRSVRLSIDGDVLEVTGATRDQQDELVAAWLRRHAEPTTTP